MRIIGLTILMALMCGLLLVPMGAAGPTLAGSILYADGAGYLHTIRPDMTGDQLVAAGSVNSTGFRPASFSLSPDARTIAFGGCSCAAGLATLNTDGSGFFAIPGTSSADTEPSWSPNRSRLAFVHYTGSAFDIATMRPDGTGRVDLTNGNPQYAQDPRWSPDGKRIVFWGSSPDGYHLFRVNAEGREFTQLTFGPYQDRRPVWSPNGTWIAFGRNSYSPTLGSGPSDIWVIRTDGSGLRQITFTGAAAPEWSPESDLSYGSGSGLVVMHKTENSQAQLIPGPYFIYYDWEKSLRPLISQKGSGT